MSLFISGDLRLRRTWQPMDTDAAAYITAVETADGQAMEERVKIAIDNFVLGCKADGIWTAIKASCILAGARTLAGALVPLVGAAPTNVGGLFVSGDYDRKTGLVGNGSTKYLNSNRNNNADPQNNRHISIWQTTVEGTTFGGVIGCLGGNNSLISKNGAFAFVGLSSAGFTTATSSATTGLKAVSRSVAASVQTRFGGASATIGLVSGAPTADVIDVFRVTASFHSNARLAFYSIGESLDLALLDARVTDLINAFAAAIP